jgi:hypothetical protein
MGELLVERWFMVPDDAKDAITPEPCADATRM